MGFHVHLLQLISKWFPGKMRALQLDINAGVVFVDKEEQ
jgi:hypothetical protein